MNTDNAENVIHNTDGLRAVSYTHLDVYKRQFNAFSVHCICAMPVNFFFTIVTRVARRSTEYKIKIFLIVFIIKVIVNFTFWIYLTKQFMHFLNGQVFTQVHNIFIMSFFCWEWSYVTVNRDSFCCRYFVTTNVLASHILGSFPFQKKFPNLPYTFVTYII